MRWEVYEYIQSNEDLQRFIREQPIWYRKLMKEPTNIEEFELAMNQYYKKTIPDQVYKLQQHIQMVSFALDMLYAMKNNT